MFFTLEMRCALCGRTLPEIPDTSSEKPTGMYLGITHDQHTTCSECVARGRNAGIGHGHVMKINKEAFHLVVQKYEQEMEKRIQNPKGNVIHFDPKKKLPKSDT